MPARYIARIVQRIKEGRWEVTASHWVENDNNLAGGEALCRHLLYTRRYMHKLFGLKPEDCAHRLGAGYLWTCRDVTDLSGARRRKVSLFKPFRYVWTARPWMFWWQGPDGSQGFWYAMMPMPGEGATESLRPN